ncbi:hypothetical protein PSV3_00237 [Septimatrevirus PSV33]|uniref:Uncharacterized protein n=1 Tax=Pseudomonas phage PSV3 TaxID=3003632 RepID=A0AAE9VWD6_9CAUD|nr:hypothetical protein PM406_gp38 [Pseudomonas phage PSV3]WBF76939.1 hypothetical protein PSV3_00237 [Pseudomonas phage PSV3]
MDVEPGATAARYRRPAESNEAGVSLSSYPVRNAGGVKRSRVVTGVGSVLIGVHPEPSGGANVSDDDEKRSCTQESFIWLDVSSPKSIFVTRITIFEMPNGDQFRTNTLSGRKLCALRLTVKSHL